jgi:hypothetical protein
MTHPESKHFMSHVKEPAAFTPQAVPAQLALPDGAPQSVPDPRRWAALVVIGIAQLMIVLDGTIVNIALPTMQRSLQMSDLVLQP